MGEKRGCRPKGQRVTMKFFTYRRVAREHRTVETAKAGRCNLREKWSEQSRNRRSQITWEGLNRVLGGTDRKIKRKTGRLDE